jgi:hypothetical protein
MSDINGKLKITFAANGVTAAIDPSCYEDPGTWLPQVKQALQKRGIDQLDLAAVDSAFQSKAANPILVGPPQPEPVDGKVQARLNEEGDAVEIKIEPPMGHGKKAELRDVMEAIKNIGAGDFYLELEKIENMLSSFRFRDFVPVGEKRDGRFDIQLSKDLTEATINVSPPFGGDAIQPIDIVQYMKREGMTTGVKIDVIKKICQDEIFNQNVVIAVGQKQMDGEDAGLEFYFDHTASKAKPTMNDEGEVDFRELNIFQTCRKGDPLVRKIPSTPGIIGKTVFGQEVKPRTGRDIPSPGGLNTIPDKADSNLILAAADGQPKWTGNKVNVVPVLEVSGDVDFSTGNINFTGSVEVRGNVISGFSIKAMGDVNIGGTVEMCTIECGGNLSVRQGIVGQDKALIMCRGTLTAKFIDKATVYCDGDVNVDESLIYSKVSSSGNVRVLGKKGFIMGGITRATKHVTANRIGTPTQSPTLIEVGGSPSLRNELEQLENEIHEAEEKTDAFSKSLDTAEKKKAQLGSELSDEQKERVLLMSRERFALLSKLRAFREKKEDLEDKLTRLKSRGLKVNVKDAALPGSKICIKTASIIMQDEIKFTTFYEKDGEIEIMPYDSSGENA